MLPMSCIPVIPVISPYHCYDDYMDNRDMPFESIVPVMMTVGVIGGGGSPVCSGTQ